MSPGPLFSVVIPVFNRARTLRRAVASVVAQDVPQIEVVVVDDGSTDDSVAVALELCRSQGVTLVRHPANLGIGPARNSGIRAARGQWIVPLDSDDELAPGALRAVMDRIQSVGNDIARLRCMVQYPDGQLSPEPNLVDEEWTYFDYLRSLDVPDCALRESASVLRRDALLLVPYPADRSHESLFHLDFFASFRVMCASLVLRIYHQDAAHTTRTAKPVREILREAPDHAAQVDQIDRRHGLALAAHAPREFRRLLASGAKWHALCGNRSRSLLYAWRAAPHHLGRILAYVGFGALGPRCLARIASLAPSLSGPWWKGRTSL